MDPLVICAAILTTILDIEEEGAPNGVIYAGLADRCPLPTYDLIIQRLVSSRLVTMEWNVLYLTEEGKAKARELNSLIS